MVESNQVL